MNINIIKNNGDVISNILKKWPWNHVPTQLNPLAYLPRSSSFQFGWSINPFAQISVNQEALDGCAIPCNSNMELEKQVISTG